MFKSETLVKIFFFHFEMDKMVYEAIGVSKQFIDEEFHVLCHQVHETSALMLDAQFLVYFSCFRRDFPYHVSHDRY